MKTQGVAGDAANMCFFGGEWDTKTQGVAGMR